MDRAMIRIQPVQGGGLQFLLDAPYDPEGRRAYNLGIDLASETWNGAQTIDEQEDVVHRVGRNLFAELRQHPALERRVFTNLINVDRTEPTAIYFEVDHSDLDRLPWEALWHPTVGFLALEERYPIARLQQPSAPPKTAGYDFATPIRFMVILSAASSDPALRASALGEWTALYETLKSARGMLKSSWNLPADDESFDVRVYVAEDDLRRRIEHQSDSWIKVSSITSLDALQDAKKEFSPHLLHIFCHGSGERLSVGTRADWNSDEDGTIDLSADNLARDLRYCWLISLNACGSAAASGNSLGLARTLVIKGIPAAIGMRERVDTRLAALLCRHFYSSLFDKVRSIELNTEQVIDWATCLWPLRERCALEYHPDSLPRDAQKIAMRCYHWTLPVLYASSETFRLKRRRPRTQTRAELVTRANKLKQQLALLPLLLDMPDAQRLELGGVWSREVTEIERQIADMDDEA